MGFFANIFGFQTPEGDSSNQQNQTAGGAEPVADDLFIDSNGKKVIPKIEFTELEPDLSSDKEDLELWGTLHNTSEVQVEITRIRLLGQNSDPSRFLKPGEKFELRLYRGDTPKNDAESRAVVTYKISGNGDYFEANYFVDYLHDDGYYVPKSIDLDRHVRDI